MAENYATQCGFCTPGFVVSLTGHALKRDKYNSSSQDAISGNICRCTGYKSIEKASYNLETQLKEVNSLDDLIASKFVPEYFKTIPKKLKTLNKQETTKVETATLVANGTDIYVRHADQLANKEVQLIGENQDLKGISINNKTCKIGASTTVTEILENKELNTIFPKLVSFLKLVSSEQIRNMGTLGGNFVNASPIGDMSIFFLALNSTLTIENKQNKSSREVPFKNFHQDYKKYDLQKSELITSISFEIPNNDTKFNFEKVSKRTHLDIASVNSACHISVIDNIINKAIIAIGGVAAIPKILEKTNQFLIGKTLSNQTVIDAVAVLQSEISPIDDVRGTTQYKRLLARQLFFAHFVALYPEKIDLKQLVLT